MGEAPVGEMSMSGEMYVSALRSSGDLGGVFEFDGETGYFYLYDQNRRDRQRIVADIHILSGQPDFTESDVEVRWDGREEMVGLLIRGRLWAAFGGGEKFGGDYRANGQPEIPGSVLSAFESKQ